MSISEYIATYGPILHDVRRLQRHRRGGPPRHPGRADGRREGGRGDRRRTLDLPAWGLQAPAGAQPGGARHEPSRWPPPAVPPGADAASTDAGLAGQVRAGDERPTGSDRRLPPAAATTRRATVTQTHHRKAVIEFPSDLEILITREFEAPLQLVFDVFTKAEHLRNTIAPFGEAVTECVCDARVGGEYRYTFVTNEGKPMTFYGTFLEVQPPTHIVDTWQYDGWPDVKAVETVDLREANGVTTVQWRLTYGDKAGRDHTTKYDGIEANFDNVEDYLRTLVEQEGASRVAPDLGER